MKFSTDYIVSAVMACILIILNFFNETIYDYLPFLPVYSIPLFSIIIVIGSIASLWKREYNGEQMKREFITVITHKFRTPITGIKWAIQMLQSDVGFQVKDDLLKEMERAIQRIMEIVDLVTGFAQFDKRLQYAYSYVSLRDLVDVSLTKYSQWIRDRKMTFKIDSSELLPPIYIDKSKIQFVVDILLENAIKYSAVGGVINVKIENNRNSLILSVEDNGMGMSQKELKMAFKRFWRSDKARAVDTEGMGLGLHTAKVIVEHHHGKMWAESKGEDKGSTFFVQLLVNKE